MTEQDPRTLALLSELQTAYQKKGPTMTGPDAERYHEVLACYVAHLNRNGGTPETLRKTLAWYDERRGAVEKDNGQLALL